MLENKLAIYMKITSSFTYPPPAWGKTDKHIREAHPAPCKQEKKWGIGLEISNLEHPVKQSSDTMKDNR